MGDFVYRPTWCVNQIIKSKSHLIKNHLFAKNCKTYNFTLFNDNP